MKRGVVMRVAKRKPERDNARLTILMMPSMKKHVIRQARKRHISVSEYIRLCIS